MSVPDIDHLKRRFQEVFGRPPRDFSESNPTFVETINAMTFIKKLKTLERKNSFINLQVSIMQDFIKEGEDDVVKRIVQKKQFVETMIQIKIICQSIINNNPNDITNELFKTFQSFFSLYDMWRNKYLNGDFTILPKCITSKKESRCSIMGGKTRRRNKSKKTSTRKRRAGKKSKSSNKRTIIRGRRNRNAKRTRK